MIDDSPEDVPRDVFAERLALWHILNEPSFMSGTDLLPLLVGKWQHRHIWRAMRAVAHGRPSLVESPGPLGHYFFRAWASTLCRAECKPEWPGLGNEVVRHEFWSPGRCAARRLWADLEDARVEEWDGVVVNDQGLMVCALPMHAAHSRSVHSFSYWVTRLQAVVDARQQITYAQSLAEQAWKWYERLDEPQPEPALDVVSIESLVS